jgi:hypothetical protein
MHALARYLETQRAGLSVAGFDKLCMRRSCSLHRCGTLNFPHPELVEGHRMVFQAQSAVALYRVSKRLDLNAASFDKLRMRTLVGSSGNKHSSSG